MGNGAPFDFDYRSLPGIFWVVFGYVVDFFAEIKFMELNRAARPGWFSDCEVFMCFVMNDLGGMRVLEFGPLCLT
jgi:hypothetical protein